MVSDKERSADILHKAGRTSSTDDSVIAFIYKLSKNLPKDILKKIALPLMVLAVMLLLTLLWRILSLPPEDRLIEIIREYFDKYGLITVLISAILEGVLLLGLYYPGGLVIFLGVLFAGNDILQVIKVVLVTTIGMMIAYALDYMMGRYGWYRLLLSFGLKEPLENAQRKLIDHGQKAIFMSYWHPNLATIISTSAGILQYPFRRFLVSSLLAVIIWNTFWGTLAYLLGETVLSLMGIWFGVIVIVVWIAFRLWSKKDSVQSEI